LAVKTRCGVQHSQEAGAAEADGATEAVSAIFTGYHYSHIVWEMQLKYSETGFFGKVFLLFITVIISGPHECISPGNCMCRFEDRAYHFPGDPYAPFF